MASCESCSRSSLFVDFDAFDGVVPGRAGTVETFIEDLVDSLEHHTLGYKVYMLGVEALIKRGNNISIGRSGVRVGPTLTLSSTPRSPIRSRRRI